MTALFRTLAMILALGLLPGAQELVEQVLHVTTGGHAAHSVQDDGEHGAVPEDGCTATMHSCACCPVRPAVATEASLVDAPATLLYATGISKRALLLAGYAELPFQPPIV